MFEAITREEKMRNDRLLVEFLREFGIYDEIEKEVEGFDESLNKLYDFGCRINELELEGNTEDLDYFCAIMNDFQESKDK